MGRYRLLGEVARGGSGAVFRAEGPDGRLVALKLLLAGRAASPLQRRRFETEVQTLLRLRHPHVVALLDAGEDRAEGVAASAAKPGEGTPFLAMEWVEGETLAARLDRDGPLAPRVAAALVRDLARAIHHAHGLGVIHRDLKPGNVLLRRGDGAALVTDFGLASDQHEQGHLDGSGSSGLLARSLRGVWLGTPGWWPPEQAMGELERIGPRTDVYGLGAVLYSALTGEPPQQGHTPAELLAAVLQDPPRPSALEPEVPAALDAACQRALQRDPAARHPDAAALADELEAFVSPRATPGEGEPPRWLAPLLVGGGSALALGLVLMAARPAPRAEPTPVAALSTSTPPDPSLRAPAPATPRARVSARELLGEASALARGGAPLAEVLHRFERVLAEARPASDVLVVARTRLERVDLLRRRGRHAEALAEAGELIATGEGRVALEARLLRVLTSLELEDYTFSLKEVGEIQRADPGGVLDLTARAAISAGRRERSGLAEAALTLDPDFLPARVEQVDALLGLDDERALEAAEELARRAPDDARVQLLLARARTGRGDAPGAGAALARALELCEGRPYPLLLHTGLACRLALGEDRALLELAEQTLQLLPGDGLALLYRGLVRHRQGDARSAVRDWVEARRMLDPDTVSVLVSRRFQPAEREAFERATGRVR